MLIASAVHPTPAWSQPSERDSVVVLPQASFPPPRVRAWQVGWARPDRIEHASLSFTLATALLLSTRDRSTAGALTLAAGLGKELLDRRGPSGFDGVDLMADAGGIALALTLVRARGD
jgi:hypothetical protein